MKKLTRHQMRENAFILIFERIFHEDSVEELLSTARECGDLEITPEVERMFRGVEGNRAYTRQPEESCRRPAERNTNF